jgi:hypothetical protein
MGRFVEGTDRGQTTLFAECLEDWICENNPVRVIKVFVEIWPNLGSVASIPKPRADLRIIHRSL